MEEERTRAGKATAGLTRLEGPAGTHTVEAINNGKRTRLSGRIGTLRIKGVHDGELDASALQARAIVLEGAVNGKSVLKLAAPGGTVTLAGLNAEANVEIDAPGGSVSTGDLNGDSRLEMRAREMKFLGNVQGSSAVALTLTANGAVQFKLLQGDSKVMWNKEKPSDPSPRIEEGEVRGSAQFAREE